MALVFLSFGRLEAAPTCPADCPGKVDMYQGLQAQSFFYKSMGTCAVMVSPSNKGTRWRSYSFFSSGLLMVFNNFGPGPVSTNTASRSYFFFPRKINPTYAFTRSGAVITASTGDRLVFDYKDARHKANLTSLKLKEDPRIHGQNEGGVEVTAQGGLVIDTGYLVGEVGHSIPTRTSLISDSRGRTCEQTNERLFRYTYATDPYGKTYLARVDLKFERDADFANFLRQNCPNLDVGPLIKDLTGSVSLKTRKTRFKKLRS
ncbi:MAG TPA: hypothetical protein VFV50_18855 [Bdellovibrionales bacterium]|nr:hypothetical protein [Bdellovibrionales bacterium]